MSRSGRYPQEFRDRAVRMVLERQSERESQWAAICSIASQFGVSHETLRKWGATRGGRRRRTARPHDRGA
jgi:transposase